MALINAKKVLAFAIKHPSFKVSLLANPKEALGDYATDLALTEEGVSIEELDALISLSDSDFKSIEKIASGFGDDFSSEEHTGGVIL